MSAEKLYTPELLALTIELAGRPFDDTLPLKGDARSQACGSTLAMALALDSDRRIERVGMTVRACAVGQAAAAIFARHCKGRNEQEIVSALDALEAWLAGPGDGDPPDWPDLKLLAPARDYPGRHGAIILPWKAATGALSSASARG